jgi:hypothetical protein
MKPVPEAISLWSFRPTAHRLTTYLIEFIYYKYYAKHSNRPPKPTYKNWFFVLFVFLPLCTWQNDRKNFRSNRSNKIPIEQTYFLKYLILSYFVILRPCNTLIYCIIYVKNEVFISENEVFISENEVFIS